ncbi:MAG: ribonuclease H [Candidatus Doudnabacteria bacterium Gr01-1014_77]|uniref:Ribonuclease H n=1 Tax=Candidatus Doudnabacteria bacterium Gr01-1014_77 TaxID=2017133 RepID=A0A554JCZ0_9BACT|nr:MAG: ribonuclease H [Candidatus Doudnabacteria bacterium Gr01-1014_77]
MNHTEEQTHLVIYTDGGARGNPGPAGIGAVFYLEDENGKRLELETLKEYIGEQTNNYAEYTALIKALQRASSIGKKVVLCYLDSELVVKQLNGLYKVREESLKPLVSEVLKLTNKFTNVSFTHVHREKNVLADKLVNQAIDEAIGKV